jgi:hypothetical protein
MEKEIIQTLQIEKLVGVSVANSPLEKQPKEKVKIRGITTSQINQALKSSNPYPARVFLREQDKNCLECANRYEEKECSACQTPIFFRIKENNNWIKPKISKGSLLELEGNYTQPTNGNLRPSFTATSYQLLSEPKPLTSQELITLISGLLSTSLEKKKEWVNRTDFLFKKLEELKELDTLTKLGTNFLNAYLTLKWAYYSNYQEKYLAADFDLTKYLQNIHLEIEQVSKHIEAYQSKQK